jgi:hypothetical protein
VQQLDLSGPQHQSETDLVDFCLVTIEASIPLRGTGKETGFSSRQILLLPSKYPKDFNGKQIEVN